MASPNLKAVLSLDTSPFVRGAAKALATGKALAAQFARNPVKFLATGAFLGAEKAIGALGGGLMKLPGMALNGLKTVAKFGTVAAAALSAGVLEAMNYGRGLKQMSDKTGITVGRLAMMKRVLGDNGIEVEALGSAMKKMDVNLIGSLKSGGTDAFESIGLFAKDLIKLDPGERLLAVGKAIAGLSDTAAQSAAAVKLLGKNGTEMLGMFRDTEGMAAAGGPLSKQAQLLDKNAKVFNDVINNLRHAGSKMRGFFVGVASEVAKVVDTLTEGAGKLDFVEMGQKLGVALKDAMKWGFALWEDPMGVMGYFWEVTKQKALELANWLHDAVEGAFPGMAVAIEDAISKTVAWGKIIVGYAMQFGEFLLDSAKSFTAWISNWWENSGIPEIWTLIKSATTPKEQEKYSKGTKSTVTRGGVVPGEPPDFNMDDSPRARTERVIANEEAKQAKRDFIGPMLPKDFVAPKQNKGADMVARGMTELANKAKGAADALQAAKIGADHFGAKAQAEKAEAMRKKIEPAIAKAGKKMDALEGKPTPGQQMIRNMTGAAINAYWTPTRLRIKNEGENRARIDRENRAVYKGPLGRREFEQMRNAAQAAGLKEIDGVPVRREGEVRAGDAARRKAFKKDEERKRLKGLTEKETLEEMLKVAKDARDANQKVAQVIAQ